MVSAFKTRLAGLLLCLGGPPSTMVQAADDYSDWSHSADFRLNTTSTGAALTGDVFDFPLLLRLDASNFPFDQAKVDGADIRFVTPAGQGLALEIERWDADAKKAEVWVRVPVIKPRTDTGFIRMYWGNPAAPAATDGSVVFATSRGFAGVWHFNADAVVDATGASVDGAGNLTTRAEGLIGDGRRIPGKNQGITVPPEAVLNPEAAITVTAWIHSDTWQGGNRRILQKGDGEIQYALFQDSDSLAWRLGGLNDPGDAAILKAPLPAPGAWHHVAATFDGAMSRIYVNGTMVASRAATGTLPVTVEALCIGCRASQNKTHNSFEGRMDEVTLAKVARSADWFKLIYANQGAQQVLVRAPSVPVQPPPVPVQPPTVPVQPPTVPVQPPTPGTCLERFEAPADLTVREGDPITLAGTADCASGFQWSVVQGPGPRILDPDAKTLLVTAPRIARDTAVVFRFTGHFGETRRTDDVRVTIRESIPDPLFSLPAKAAWNGRDTLALTPVISNLKAVKASRDSLIRYTWTLDNLTADTTLREGSLLLCQAEAGGTLKVRLCLDNGGAAHCQSTLVAVDLVVGIRRMLEPGVTGTMTHTGSSRLRDAMGRVIKGDGDERTRTGKRAGVRLTY